MLAGSPRVWRRELVSRMKEFHPLINWYFLMISTVTVAFVIVLVAKRFTFTRLDQMYGIAKMDVADEDKTVSPAEMRGLKFAGIACVIFIAILLCLTVPENGFFRSPEGKILPSSPFMDSLMFLLFAFFTTVGIAYGIGAGVIKSEKDMVRCHLFAKWSGSNGTVGS